MPYIIPARFYQPLKSSDLEPHGWRYSALAKEYFLEDSLTDKEQSGVWIRYTGGAWSIIDCNYTEHRVIHRGPLTLIELIRITHRLWT